MVRDAGLRQKLGAIYRKASDIAEAVYAARGRPPHLSERQFARMMAAGKYLWDHMGEAPVLLLPCARSPALPPREALPPAIATRWGEEVAYADRIRGASVYPAVQNVILACRAFGLGTVLTTIHAFFEEEVRAILNLPPDIQTYALMPIGYPQGHHYPVKRRPVGEVACLDTYGKPWST